MSKISIKIFTKPDCSLCEPFKEMILSTIQKPKWKDKIAVEFTNIDLDAEAFEKYCQKIPVAEINGRLAFKYHITQKELETYLSRLTDC